MNEIMIQSNNDLREFTNEQFGTVRMMMRDGEPWFVAVDVCKALDIDNARKAVSRLEDDERMTVTSSDGHSGQRGGAQCMNIVNEPGLYTLVLGSRKPEARAFKRWITHDVIPSIRKHGGYLTLEAIKKTLYNPDFLIGIANALKAEQAKNKSLLAENAALTGSMLDWDYKAFVTAAVRRYSGSIRSKEPGVRFGCAWKAFKQEVLYKHSINLESRLTRRKNSGKGGSKLRLMDVVKPSEMQKRAGTIIAMCKEANVDIQDLLQNIPTSAEEPGVQSENIVMEGEAV